jgi:hypothetical protein
MRLPQGAGGKRNLIATSTTSMPYGHNLPQFLQKTHG